MKFWFARFINGIVYFYMKYMAPSGPNIPSTVRCEISPSGAAYSPNSIIL